MKQIFLDWWNAHLFEYIVSGTVISLVLLVFIIWIIVEIIRGEL